MFLGARMNLYPHTEADGSLTGYYQLYHPRGTLSM